MKLIQIEDSLPNGFHDSILLKIDIDYANREATFEVEVCVSGPNKEKNVQTRYRRGNLKLSDLFFCVIEAPDSTYQYYEQELMMDSGPMESLKTPPPMELPKDLPDGAFTHWFFVYEWNSFIYVSAVDAEFRWLNSDG